MSMNEIIEKMTAEKTELEAQFAELCGDYKTALRQNNAAQMAAAVSALSEAEKRYAKVMATITYANLAERPQPVMSALRSPQFTVRKHREEKVDGVTIGLEMADKQKSISLTDFYEYVHYDTAWYLKLQKLNQLMCLRAAQELKVPKQEVARVSASFFMTEAARKIDMGETPTSNTQLLKLLQDVVDAIMGWDGEKAIHGERLKVRSQDVAAILAWSKKHGKAFASIKCASNADMLQYLLEMMHTIAVDGKYRMEYKSVKAADAAPAETVTIPAPPADETPVSK